jgi:hypothetical protein
MVINPKPADTRMKANKTLTDYYHMISAHEYECAMCGKYVFVSDGVDRENEGDWQLENTSALPTVVVEQIDGSQYTFDNESCALLFKKFNAVYGIYFADQ